MYLHSFLRSATEIINLYDGAVPLAAWLKAHFKQHKKFGSKDRKIVSDLCYCYYRLGKAWRNKAIEERLLIGQFLCNKESVFIKELKPEWTVGSSLATKEKIQFIGEEGPDSIFPFWIEVSNEMNTASFIESHLIQPELFLRIRPGKKSIVIKKLEATSIKFSVKEDCIRLPNMSKVDDVLEIDREVVVQDKSSQKVLDNLLPTANYQLSTFTSWDCCAASGGKTILLQDHFPKARLTVSDVRESILHNLRSRFKRAGISHYQAFVADVASSTFISKLNFDLIICDTPCSGSGTWSRTPEQLTFFKKNKIDEYANLQKAIAINASKSLKEGGYFLYITCSVFKKENEDVVRHIAQKTNLRLIKQEYFKGYTNKADTLFTALFLL